MNKLLAFLRIRSESALDEQVVERVIEASLADACDKVLPRVSTMSLSEARGYVRARAVDVVRRQTRIVLSRNTASDELCRNQIVRTATELLVPLVLRETRVGVPQVCTLPVAA